MNPDSKYLDSLFIKARTQHAQVSFEETSLRFTQTLEFTHAGSPSLWKQLREVLSSPWMPVFLIPVTIIAFYFVAPNSEQCTAPETLANKARTQVSPQATSSGQFSGDLPDPDAISSGSFDNPSRPIERLAAITNADVPQLSSNQQVTLQHDWNVPIASPRFNTPITATSTADSSQLFQVTERTTVSDFERIKQQASDVGITFKYHVHHHKLKGPRETWLLQDFDIEMLIPGSDITSTISVSVPERGKYVVEFGWFLDENGRPAALTEDISLTEASSFYPK